jgi:Ca2+-binding EF-hand superfamily protein
MFASRIRIACCLCLFAVTVAAQIRTPVSPEPPGTVGHTRLEVHDPQASRELFAACDGNGDDRLDLFEASAAIETLGDPRDSSGFRLLDRDRDGYLDWSEFDDHFRAVVGRGRVFRVKTCRRFAHSAPEVQQAKSATPLERYFQLHDVDENGGLDPDEVSRIVKELGLQPLFEAQLRNLDRDQSGRIEATELMPFFERMQGKIALPGLRAAPESGLPGPWTAIDADGDGAIDLGELQVALRRIDSGLARWARHLLQRHDADADGKLSADELRAGLGEPAPGGATAPKSPLLSLR